MKKFNKGFTLIELLVVIAIIGILSSIVLASLSSARTKGEDAAIRTNLSNMRAQAELYYSNNSNYGSNGTAYSAACPTTAVVVGTGGLMGVSGNGGLLELSAGLSSRAGAGATKTVCAVSANGTAWAVAAVLKSDLTKAACVDSTGASKTVTITSGTTLTTLGAAPSSAISTAYACN